MAEEENSKRTGRDEHKGNKRQRMNVTRRGAAWAPQRSGKAFLRSSLSGKMGVGRKLFKEYWTWRMISDLFNQPHDPGEVTYLRMNAFVCKMGVKTHVQLQMVLYMSERREFFLTAL